MPNRYSRRDWLKRVGATVAVGQAAPPVPEVKVETVSQETVRITIGPPGQPVPQVGALVQESFGPVVFHSPWKPAEVRSGRVLVKLASDPSTIRVNSLELRVDPQTGGLSFPLGAGPLLGLGQGGPQFDRRGSTDTMRSGQGGYRLRTHGGRVPVQWLISPSGWAMFIHQPLGTFDFTGAEGKFIPGATPFPLDFFVVTAHEPAAIMAEYARITGHPEMPPLWSLGYQQSHRTLSSREEILAEARTFREKKLPCDTLIYLGTGFCPSGWNTGHGSWTFNSSVFPDPKEMIRQLHEDHFKIALHVVVRSRAMRGTVRGPCDQSAPAEEQPSCYWNAHRDVFSLGVDGWWPDEGDPFNLPSRLTRNRMYYEGPQLDRPNERPYALHRNGGPGMQRYASFLWSGDVYSTWQTLATHIPVAVNASLSGIPYWGTDIGGFIPTRDFTGELYVRWFQFGSFCPLFRSHGRTWKLRLPWGWNTGELGPNEITASGDVANPDPSELHNAAVEPICKKYLELRYRLMPYLYSTVREACQTGLSVIRALWLHFAGDPAAAARGDEYMWGPSMLVAPVVEKGAASRRLYLPRGVWYDFWTQEKIEGGREINRAVDLATMPLYVRAGAILPMGPVKQYTGEKVDGPLSLIVHPGADGAFLIYEDDGASFNYRRGEWMGIQANWDDRRRRLSLRLAEGSRLLRKPAIEVRVLGEKKTRALVFQGRPTELRW